MLSQLRPAVVMIALFTLITGLAYPLAITGIAELAFPRQAQGSLIRAADGHILGSSLIAQGFAKPGYLHPRGSAAGSKGYDATSSSGSNLGPMDPKLASAVANSAAALRKDNPQAVESGALIPADAVTQSGSGLDPDISPENAAFQASRIAKARGLPIAEIRGVIANNMQWPILGFIGQPYVNVLAVNRALDAR